MRVLVTGASGFVGRALVGHLAALPNYAVIAASRERQHGPVTITWVQSPDLTSPQMGWRELLSGVDAVVHCAGLAHLPASQAARAELAFDQINHRATAQLARDARDAGVRRFVFLSSIKVHGEGQRSPDDTPYRFDSAFAPSDAYARSKVHAEQALVDLCTSTSMNCIVIRPPLIHGPGVGANFAALIRLVERGVPLPVASIHNARSLLSVSNLCDLIAHCLVHPHAAGQAFLAADGQPWSTPELIRAMAAGLHRPARLLPIPVPLLHAIAALTGQGAAITRLSGSLVVDDSQTRQLLQWTPPMDVRAALLHTVQAYRAASGGPPLL